MKKYVLHLLGLIALAIGAAAPAVAQLTRVAIDMNSLTKMASLMRENGMLTAEIDLAGKVMSSR